MNLNKRDVKHLLEAVRTRLPIPPSFLIPYPIFLDKLPFPEIHAEHFLHHFIHVWTLHCFDSMNGLDELDDIFAQYARSIESLYVHRASLCSLHMHSHLVRQVINHRALGMPSCFARESSRSSAVKICHSGWNVLSSAICGHV